MHSQVYQEFERICRNRRAGGAVLEVGAVPGKDLQLLMPVLGAATRRIGLNLDGPHRFENIDILRGNANDMNEFHDGEFDTVLCNATLEHDPFFWKSLAEIRRVLKPGGLAVIGVPGYDQPPHRAWRRVAARLRPLPVLGRAVETWLSATPTLVLHQYPGDFYRFSAETVRQVFFAGYRDVAVSALMQPPRFVGSGIKAD